MKPIIFNTEMVKAILDGRKTQTIRVFSETQLKYFDYAQKLGEMNSLDDLHKNDFSYILQFSKYKVDDVLYIKETFQFGDNIRNIQNIPLNKDTEVLYYEDEINSHNSNNKDFAKIIKWKPSIHMPKKYARIFLRVTNVRVERLQDITAINMDSDMGTISPIISKLIAIDDYIELQNKYKKYWNSTAKDGYKWKDNPYVFVYEFEIVKLGEVK